MSIVGVLLGIVCALFGIAVAIVSVMASLLVAGIVVVVVGAMKLAVAPIAGLTMAWMPQQYKHTRSIPLFEIHGTQDRVSEWTGDMENKGGWGA